MGSDAKRVFPSLETFLDSSTSWADAVDDRTFDIRGAVLATASDLCPA